MRTALLVFSVGLAGVSALAQNVISAKSGMIHYTEGDVTIDDGAIEPKRGQFAELKNGQILKTAEGRAEMLLGPSAFLRLAENSSVLMLDNRLSDTRVQILSGSVMVECLEVLKGNNTTLVAATVPMVIRKAGLFRVDLTQNADAFLRVHAGEVAVGAPDKPMIAKKGSAVALGATLQASKFDPKLSDGLYRWASMRSDSLSLANLSAARGMMDMRRSWAGGWLFNPWYGMYTYVPYRGIYNSPFGGSYYSPDGVWAIYNQPVQPTNSGGSNNGGYYDSNRGYTVTSERSSDRGSYSTGSVASGSTAGGSTGGESARSSGDSGGSRGDSSAGGRGK